MNATRPVGIKKPSFGMAVEHHEFDRIFGELVERFAPEAIKQGLFKAASELLRDAIYEPPQAPFKEGHLRGSARTDQIVINRATGEISIRCGFNIEYAAKWHEVPETRNINWTTTGAKSPGPKYLESKMARNGQKYRDIVGEHLRNLLASKKGGAR